MLLGFVLEHEVVNQDGGLVGWQSYLDNLAAARRATILEKDGRRIWCCAERLPQCLAVFDGATLHPPITAAGPYANTAWTREAALVELLRGRLEGLGPVSEAALAKQLGRPDAEVRAALAVLQGEGFAMQGNFTGAAGTEWCERALLARIHRYTLKTLRQEIRPVSARALMRFLFRWHGMGSQRAEGEAALATAIGRLEGFPVAAGSWEDDVLPARVGGYLPVMLDRLCASGRVAWLRPRNARRPADAAARGALLRQSPVCLLERGAARFWHAMPAAPQAAAVEPGANASIVQEVLRRRGALFFLDIVQETGLLRTQVEEALAELAAAGRVTSDSFAGLRALILPPSRRQAYNRLRRRRGGIADPIDEAGRWSLQEWPRPPEPADGWLRTPPEVLEHVAQVLLKRYGVVFRKVLERETLIPPWRELLYVFRRLEARGEIRGGRFVEGFTGEQFALPEAVGLLRNLRESPVDEFIAIAAADPLNLTGVILPGERIPATAAHRIIFRDGVPVARQSGRDVTFLEELGNEESWQVRNLFARRRNPAGYFPTPGRPA
jgi:ATP-dependent Lhr-like helicase